MLKCREVVNQASTYVDRELNWKQAMSMGMHLLLCRKCRRFIQYFRLSIQMLINRKTLSAEEAEAITSKIINNALSNAK